jgi:hypothetical protein
MLAAWLVAKHLRDSVVRVVSLLGGTTACTIVGFGYLNTTARGTLAGGFGIGSIS